ncbi:hypothetical protein CCHR01_11557 [Colletotrichum chrysophilum]|uniref:Uncharacterized protein n=1 Tax=Colletotrichum chrysophilum TaxID=1836956 RepID=A0AAD9AEC0_9PEZI|nr:hypothetical protein CCHR01_11557 [Colletotrichum chrysophilum]
MLPFRDRGRRRPTRPSVIPRRALGFPTAKWPPTQSLLGSPRQRFECTYSTHVHLPLARIPRKTRDDSVQLEKFSRPMVTRRCWASRASPVVAATIYLIIRSPVLLEGRLSPDSVTDHRTYQRSIAERSTFF